MGNRKKGREESEHEKEETETRCAATDKLVSGWNADDSGGPKRRKWVALVVGKGGWRSEEKGKTVRWKEKEEIRRKGINCWRENQNGDDLLPGCWLDSRSVTRG